MALGDLQANLGAAKAKGAILAQRGERGIKRPFRQGRETFNRAIAEAVKLLRGPRRQPKRKRERRDRDWPTHHCVPSPDTKRISKVIKLTAPWVSVMVSPGA